MIGVCAPASATIPGALSSPSPGSSPALGDEKVREMALRAPGLSDQSLQAITDMIDSARTVEGLPGSVGGGGSPAS